MNAIAVVQGQDTVQPVEVPPPSIQRPTQALVRVLLVGVCGSDRFIARGEEPVDFPAGDEYMVLGHEVVGRVEETGAEVRHVQPGDLVTASVRRGCGECASCVRDEPDLCYTGRFRERGMIREHGFMTRYVVDEEAYLVRLAPELGELGVLAQPMSTCEKGLELVRCWQARLAPRCGHHEHGWDREAWGGCKRALVLGTGPMGMLAAFLLRLHGVETTVMARHGAGTRKAALVQATGAIYRSIREISLDEHVPVVPDLDLIVEATGAPQVAPRAMRHLGSNGVLLLLSIPGPGAAVPTDVARLERAMVFGNQAILGSINASVRHVEMAARHLEQLGRSYGDALAGTLGQVYPLEGFREALYTPPDDVVKVALRPS